MNEPPDIQITSILGLRVRLHTQTMVITNIVNANTAPPTDPAIINTDIRPSELVIIIAFVVALAGVVSLTDVCLGVGSVGSDCIFDVVPTTVEEVLVAAGHNSNQQSWQSHRSRRRCAPLEVQAAVAQQQQAASIAHALIEQRQMSHSHILATHVNTRTTAASQTTRQRRGGARTRCADAGWCAQLRVSASTYSVRHITQLIPITAYTHTYHRSDNRDNADNAANTLHHR